MGGCMGVRLGRQGGTGELQSRLVINKKKVNVPSQ